MVREISSDPTVEHQFASLPAPISPLESTADGWPCFDVVRRKALPARACSELRLAGAHAVDYQGDASRGTAYNPNRPVHPPQTTTRGPPRGANQATCRCCPLGTSKKQKCCRIVSSKRERPQPRYRRPNAQLQWTRSSRRPSSWVLGRKRHLLPGNRGGARVASEHAAG